MRTKAHRLEEPVLNPDGTRRQTTSQPGKDNDEEQSGVPRNFEEFLKASGVDPARVASYFGGKMAEELRRQTAGLRRDVEDLEDELWLRQEEEHHRHRSGYPNYYDDDDYYESGRTRHRSSRDDYHRRDYEYDHGTEYQDRHYSERSSYEHDQGRRSSYTPHGHPTDRQYRESERSAQGGKRDGEGRHEQPRQDARYFEQQDTSNAQGRGSDDGFRRYGSAPRESALHVSTRLWR